MEKKCIKTFTIDGDTLHISYRYDEASGVWLGEYPYFEEEPRYTPSGRRWRNTAHDGCPYGTAPYRDCGSCAYLVLQNQGDLIGVCFHEEMRQAVHP